MPAWNTLIGHAWAIRILQRDLGHKRVRHAYLFTGPRGIGKRTLARTFAQALLCAAAEPPCGHCRSCRLAEQGRHPDLLIVEPEVSGGRVQAEKIKIEPVRQLIYDLNLRPVEAARRVACLLRFDLAGPEAMNAFLKTLEEPPGEAVILVTAETADGLLPTIVSRCQSLPLRPLPVDQVRQALISRWGEPAERAGLLAHISGGRLGIAVQLRDDESALEARAEQLDDLDRLLRATRVERFAYAEQMARTSRSDALRATLDLWASYWRDVLIAGAGAAAPLTHVDRASQIHALAQLISPPTAAAALAGVLRTGELLARNANARLALEVMLMDWPRLDQGKP